MSDITLLSLDTKYGSSRKWIELYWRGKLSDEEERAVQEYTNPQTMAMVGRTIIEMKRLRMEELHLQMSAGGAR